MIDALEIAQIRKAHIEDSNFIKKLILEFHEESLGEYKISFDWSTIDETIKNFINHHIVLVAEKSSKIVGLIAGLVIRSMFDANQLLGQETIWFITKDERKGATGFKLLKMFEQECKIRGCKFVAMVFMQNLMPDVLERFYRSQNYKKMEVQFVKEL